MALNAVLSWGISVAIQLLIEFGKQIYNILSPMGRLKKAIEDTNDAISKYESTSQELETVNSRLKEIEQKISEINNRTPLSLTDKADLETLQAETRELIRQKEILESDAKTGRNNAVSGADDVIANFDDIVHRIPYFPSTEHWSNFVSNLFSFFPLVRPTGGFFDPIPLIGPWLDNKLGLTQTPEEKQKDIDEAVQTVRESLKVLWDSGYRYQNGSGEFDAKIEEYEQFLYEDLVRDGADISQLSKYLLSMSKYQDEITQIKEQLAKDTFDVTALENLFNSNEDFKELFISLIESGALGEDFKEQIAGNDGVVSAEEAATISTKQFESVLPLLVNELNKVESAAGGTASSIASLSKIYDSLKESVEPLSKAYEEMTQNGSLSADTLFNLLESYPELISNIEIENGLYKINSNLLKEQFELKKQDRIAELERTNAKLIAARKNITATKEEIKAEIDLVKTKLMSAKVSGVTTVDLANLRIQLQTLEDFEKYEKSIAMLSNLSLSNISSSSSQTADKNKEAAEKYFDKLKYQLETNQITEEQYLKSLDAAYKKYYGDKSKYLEEFAEYSQEVYDGFKDMYKDDLEAQKEAWEEKKDAVSEYYDNLREEIENTHDEEDYEKEQSEKRKEIFDLDMQIAELMRDGSEKAKARIAELEEERIKAEEELLDFETDKAREDELSRLEKEQEAEEKKIQDKIDGIQEQLDKLDEDTISVREAIIAYAKEKGVTLSFAYASGTRSSVGGFGRINEKGVEMISAPDGNGNYVPMLPNSYVFSAKATEFLWKLATEHSLPQAMYNSIAKSIKTQSSTPSVNIAQPITITMGDVIIKGNADKQTVADIKKQQENTVRMVLQKIKELQK